MKKNPVIAAAHGEIPFDLVIRNVQYVNLLTKEIYDSEIGIVDGRIGHINQPGETPLQGKTEYDAGSRYAIPGLIDTHVHTESSMMTPANMAKAILPHGTTTIACDPHEIANVLGIEGVKYIIDASRDIPLTVYVLAPSCVPSVIGLETAGAAFTKEEIAAILQMERVIGLGEVMDFPGVIHQSERMMSIIETAAKHTRFLQGHAPNLTGRDLSAYLAAGICSCHETNYSEEARYKLRAGMTLECRESSIAQNIGAIAPVLKECNYPPTATLCTDDREPDDLLKDGHLDHVIRRAIAEGIPPIEAIKMATYNAAQLIDVSGIGLLKPGNLANILLLDSLDHFKVNEVFVKGMLIAKAGKMAMEIPKREFPLESRNTVILKAKPTEQSFTIKSSKPTVKVNVISFNPRMPIITDLEEIELPTRDGFIDISAREDIAILSIFERHGINGNHSTCFIKDLGLVRGAIASTVAHDCHNLLVLGKDIHDMVKAVDVLSNAGGGFVCVAGGKTEALVELPIAGLLSTKPAEEIARQNSLLKQKINEFGIRGNFPALLLLVTFALPVIPNVRLTDHGLVDVNTQTLIPLQV
ncbi:MAG TPA: adenine deaminase [Firmicutes bacterium]|nr:adenine deaminase [Bacillota bacterium]